MKIKILGLFLALIMLAINFPPGDQTAQAVGCALVQGKAYKTSQSKTVFFITQACTKRPFNNPQKFFSYFNHWSDVEVTTLTKLAAVPDDTLGFMPWGANYAPQYGALMKSVNNPRVYFIINNKKSWIQTEAVFTGLGYQYQWIEDASDELIAKYQEGEVINYTDHHPDYSIIKYQHSAPVYQIVPDPNGTNTQYKKHLINETVFLSLGLRFDRIVTIDPSESYADLPVTNQSDTPISQTQVGRLAPITTKILRVEIDGDFNPTALMTAANWSLISTVDQNFAGGKTPSQIGRFTATLDADDHDKNGQTLADRVLRHQIYLTFDSEFQLDRQYSLYFNSGNYRWYDYDGTNGSYRAESHTFPTITFTFGQNEAVSQAIKINQLGYSGVSQKKYAYVGYWLGSNGALTIPAGTTYIINRAADGITVTEGILSSRGFDSQAGENVFQINLNNLSSGRYYLEVSGIGRSVIFNIGGNQFNGLYSVARGLYHQRAGISIGNANSDWTHGICHTQVYKSDALEDWGKDFPASTPKQNLLSLTGGWYDAGDYDRRPVHLTTVAHLLAVQEIFSDKLTDNLFNLPESGNGLPDLLDEALFGLKLFEQLQESDGAIRAGVQASGHPAFSGCEGDTLTYWTYAKNRYASYYFASTAAQAGRLLRDKYHQPAQGQALIDKAAKAFAWADSQTTFGTTSPVTRTDDQKKVELNWVRMSAAGSLFTATGQATYQDIFKSLWHDLKGPTHYNTVHFLWNYTQATSDNTDQTLKTEIINRIIASADQFVGYLDQNKYLTSRGPGYNIAWGSGTTATQYVLPVILAYKFKPEQKYIDTVAVNIDYQLGANPNGKSWITGLGYNSPEFPLHLNSMYDSQSEPVPGLPINGPHYKTYTNGICTPEDYWQCMVYNGFYPNMNSIPALQQYAPWSRMAPMNEFTVWTDMGYTIAAFAFQYAVSGENAPVNQKLGAEDYPIWP